MGVVHKFRGRAGGFDWEDVTPEGYDSPSARDVVKRVMIGPKEGAANFSLRYFEVEPGGRSALDLHEHDHGVLVLRGRGAVQLGEQRHEIGFGDVIYIAPKEVHQFENTGSEPLGFLCVAPAKR